MAYYQFESEWVLTSGIESVFDALLDYRQFEDWWPSVRRVRLHDEGDASHLGARASYTLRSPLLYSLDFDTRITAIDRPTLIRIAASGDLAGVGTYHLATTGSNTSVRYLWNVATTKPWMNLVAPLAKPAFVWAHHSVMREGGAGLAEHLGGRLISCSSRVVGDERTRRSAASGVS